MVPRLTAILRDYLTRTRPDLATAQHDEWFFVRVHGASGGRTSRNARREMGGRTVFHLVRRAVEPIVGRHVHPHMLRHSYYVRSPLDAAAAAEAGGAARGRMSSRAPDPLGGAVIVLQNVHALLLEVRMVRVALDAAEWLPPKEQPGAHPRAPPA